MSHYQERAAATPPEPDTNTPAVGEQPLKTEGDKLQDVIDRITEERKRPH